MAFRHGPDRSGGAGDAVAVGADLLPIPCSADTRQRDKFITGDVDQPSRDAGRSKLPSSPARCDTIGLDGRRVRCRALHLASRPVRCHDEDLRSAVRRLRSTPARGHLMILRSARAVSWPSRYEWRSGAPRRRPGCKTFVATDSLNTFTAIRRTVSALHSTRMRASLTCRTKTSSSVSRSGLRLHERAPLRRAGCQDLQRRAPAAVQVRIAIRRAASRRRT